jgi:ketosteroid isomerase-like protein
MLKAIIGFVVGAAAVYIFLVPPAGDTEEASNLSNSPVYLANLAVVKSMHQAHMDEDMETWSTMIADSLKWSAPSYGSVNQAGTKEDWAELLKSYQDDFDDISIQQAIYLPGLDAVTAEPDGSVRVYIHWKGTHTSSGVVAEPWYYANYDFEGGKIVAAVEFMDVGGMRNHIAEAAAASESE